MVSERMRGFPAEPESLVTLADWQDPPNQRWAFRRVRELIPTQLIAAADRPSELERPGGPDPAGPDPAGPGGIGPGGLGPGRLGDVGLTRLDGSSSTVAEVVAGTWTDAFLVLHRGRLVVEHYEAGFDAATPHLLMSVTKSVVGCVTGTLVADGLLAPDDPVEKHVPEVAGCGYAGATVRDLLDMRTGVAYREEYTDPDAEVRVMERSMGWRPPEPGDPVGSYAFLTTLGAEGDDPEGRHGGRFVYRSADTDLLGWVCERAAGVRMADLVADRIWRPIGAEHPADITCDAVGTAIHDGGMSCTARDLVRFGRMLLNDGALPDGTSAVPAQWLVHARTPDAGTLQAFADSGSGPLLPGGWYRNQLWFIPGRHGPLQLCLGIHGQLVYVDRATDTVGVKLSSWPQAQNLPYLLDTVRALDAIAAEL